MQGYFLFIYEYKKVVHSYVNSRNFFIGIYGEFLHRQFSGKKAETEKERQIEGFCEEGEKGRKTVAPVSPTFVFPAKRQF